MDKLYEELKKYGQSDYYPFHMPGHKRNMGAVDGGFPFDMDITEIHGFDNLHHPEGILLSAQERLSSLYGTKESFFCVNGSTGALLSAISATVRKGGHILIARNCHKAVYHGIYLRDLVPTYLYPHSDLKLGINGGISPSHVERCLEEDKKIEAVLLTSPTYDGVVSDIKKIAEIVHRYGIPLIVDEAHGAHFRFSSYFPKSAVDLGADVVIHSFHKTLPSMTQTAVLHLCSDRVDREKIKRFLGIYQTSSPSYVLMASLDACVDKLMRQGEEMFQEFVKHLRSVRGSLSLFRHIRLVPAAGEEGLFLGRQEEGTRIQTSYFNHAFDFDRSKVILSTLHSSLGGVELKDILREKYHLEMEMETENYVIAMTAVGDTKEGLERLRDAVSEIDGEEAKKEPNLRKVHFNEYQCRPQKQMLSISKAMDAPAKRYSLEESVGRISGEFAYLYPPGIPILVPGEQITGLFVRDVKRYADQKLNLQGLSDKENKTILTVQQ